MKTHVVRESQHPESKLRRIKILRDADVPGFKRCLNLDTGKEVNIAIDQLSYAKPDENPS